MSASAELTAGLLALTAQVTKIATEVGGLKATVSSLEDALANAAANANAVPQEVIDAFNALKTQVQAVDDLVPDAIAPAPEVVADPVPEVVAEPVAEVAPEVLPVDDAPVEPLPE